MTRVPVTQVPHVTVPPASIFWTETSTLKSGHSTHIANLATPALGRQTTVMGLVITLLHVRQANHSSFGGLHTEAAARKGHSPFCSCMGHTLPSLRSRYEGCRLRDRSERKQNRQKIWVKKGNFAMTSVHEIALEVRINDPSSLGVNIFSVFLDVEHTQGHERSLKRRPS